MWGEILLRKWICFFHRGFFFIIFLPNIQTFSFNRKRGVKNFDCVKKLTVVACYKTKLLPHISLNVARSKHGWYVIYPCLLLLFVDWNNLRSNTNSIRERTPIQTLFVCTITSSAIIFQCCALNVIWYHFAPHRCWLSSNEYIRF